MSEIKTLFNDPEFGLLGAQEFYNKLKSKGVKVTFKEVKDELAHLESYSLNKNVVKKYSMRKTIVDHVDQQWQADLVEMDVPTGAPADQNDGIRYLLTVIDCFSKYAWARPLKSKADVHEAFTDILSKGRIPERLQTDKGTEFYNKKMDLIYKQHNINHFSTQGDTKAAIVERFNRTLKMKMGRWFSSKQTFRYIDVLQKLVDNYNNTKSRPIKMTPVEASKKENHDIVFDNLYHNYDTNVEPRYKVGDLVRTIWTKGRFSKEHIGKWTPELFRIDKISRSNPPSYFLKDIEGEEIEGAYYEEELQQVPESVLNEPRRIDKIIKERGKGDKKEYFVSYIGWESKFNEWIPASKLQAV